MHDITLLQEWIKWLKYTPVYEYEKINSLKNKDINTLSSNELKELTNYIDSIKLADLLSLYGTDSISQEDSIKIDDFLNTNDLNKYMLTKLTKDEIEYANTKINRLIKTNKMNETIEYNLNNYSDISMVNAYVLHVLLSDDKLHEKIKRK